MLSLRYPSPRNMIPSQISIFEIFLHLLDLPKITSPSHPIHTTTKAKVMISYFNQIVPNKTSVNGAHTFAPMMTHTALCSQMTPAHTKAKIIKETTLLLWSMAVTNAQVNMDFILFWVKFLRIFLKVLVVRFFMASSKTCIPKRNMPSHHTNSQILVQDMHIMLTIKDQNNYTQNSKKCKFCPLKKAPFSLYFTLAVIARNEVTCNLAET